MPEAPTKVTEVRRCRTPGCERSVLWPANPEILAAYCAECTVAVMYGRPSRLPVG